MAIAKTVKTPPSTKTPVSGGIVPRTPSQIAAPLPVNQPGSVPPPVQQPSTSQVVPLGANPTQAQVTAYDQALYQKQYGAPTAQPTQTAPAASPAAAGYPTQTLTQALANNNFNQVVNPQMIPFGGWSLAPGVTTTPQQEAAAIGANYQAAGYPTSVNPTAAQAAQYVPTQVGANAANPPSPGPTPTTPTSPVVPIGNQAGNVPGSTGVVSPSAAPAGSTYAPQTAYSAQQLSASAPGTAGSSILNPTRSNFPPPNTGLTGGTGGTGGTGLTSGTTGTNANTSPALNFSGLPVYSPSTANASGTLPASPTISTPGDPYPTMPQATGRNQLGQSINYQQNLAVSGGQNLENQSLAQADTADQQAAYYQQQLAGAYAPLLAGQGGYTPAQAAQIQNESGQFGLQNLNPSSYLSNLAGNATNINSAVGGETGNVNQALTQGASAVNATINPSQLQWTPQMTQALQNAAAQSAGAQTQATMQQIQNNAFAAGNVSPLAIQAAENRAQQTGAISAANAMTQAQVQANQAQLGAAQTYANIASQNAQETAQRNTGAQLQVGAQNVGAQTSLAGLGQQATGSQQSELASANQIQSGQAQTVANANLQAGQSARNNYLGTQAQQATQTGLTASNQALGAFGSQVGGANQAAGIQVQKEAVDQSQNAASLIFGKDGMVVPLKRGAVQNGPVTAIVGEEPDPKSPSGYAPEAIVPLGPPRQEALGAVHLPAVPRTPINLKPETPKIGAAPHFASASGRLGTVRPPTPGIPPQALGRTMTRSGFQRILPQFDDGGVFGDDPSQGMSVPPAATPASQMNIPPYLQAAQAQQAQNANIPPAQNAPMASAPPVGPSSNPNPNNMPTPIASATIGQQAQQAQNAKRPMPSAWQRAAAIAAAVGAGRIAPGLAKQLMGYGISGQPLSPQSIAAGAVSGIAGRRNPALGQLAGWGAGSAVGSATGAPGQPKSYLPNGMPVYGEGGIVTMDNGGVIPMIGDVAAAALGMPPDAFNSGSNNSRAQSPAAAAEQAALAQTPPPPPPNNLSSAINGGPTTPPPNVAQAAQNNYWQNEGGEHLAWDNPAAPVPYKFGAGGGSPSHSLPIVGGGGGGAPTPAPTPKTPTAGMPPVVQTVNPVTIPDYHLNMGSHEDVPNYNISMGTAPTPSTPTPPVLPKPVTPTPTPSPIPPLETVGSVFYPGSPVPLPGEMPTQPDTGDGAGSQDNGEQGGVPTDPSINITYPDLPGAGGTLPPGTGEMPTQPDVGGTTPPDVGSTPISGTNTPDQTGSGGDIGNVQQGGGGEEGGNGTGYDSGYYFGEQYGKDGGVYLPVMNALKRKSAKPMHYNS